MTEKYPAKDLWSVKIVAPDEMSEETQVTVFLGIPYGVLCLAPWVMTVIKVVGTNFRMMKADRPLFNRLYSLRSWFRPRAERRALLQQMFGKDPRIEPLYNASRQWAKRTVIVWIGSFLILVLFGLVYSGVAIWLGVDQ